jgi:hypothetical protein
VRVRKDDGFSLPATVVQARFKTHVFRGDISIRYPDGTMDLVEGSG